MFIPPDLIKARTRLPEAERGHGIDLHRGGAVRLQAPDDQGDKPSYLDAGECASCGCPDFALLRDRRRGQWTTRRWRCRHCGRCKTTREKA